MIKILHSADWHLDSPLQGRGQRQSRRLRKELSRIPERVSQLCRQENCDILVLSGDLFDGAYTKEGYRLVYDALQEVGVPVFISPGNHDPLLPDSPWLTELWPENVHIFKRSGIESVALPELNCRVYGAGFESMDCPGLLAGFRAEQAEKHSIGVFHGDHVQAGSPYNPITTLQIQQSGLQYLALGHSHKCDQFFQGSTLCAWPGCPVGRGYDEQGEKGVLLVTVDEIAQARFIPLDSPRFYDLEVTAGENAEQALAAVLPPAGTEDFYRITLTGPSQSLDIPALQEAFCRFPNLELRDKTVPPLDIWGTAGEDTFEGLYFKLLRQQLEGKDARTRSRILQAARISRELLSGQEVELP